MISDVKFVMVHELTPYSIHCLVSCHLKIGRSNCQTLLPYRTYMSTPWTQALFNFGNLLLKNLKYTLKFKVLWTLCLKGDVTVDEMVGSYPKGEEKSRLKNGMIKKVKYHTVKGTNGRQKTYEIFHVYCIFYPGFMCQITVIFGITKDGSLESNNLAS